MRFCLIAVRTDVVTSLTPMLAVCPWVQRIGMPGKWVCSLGTCLVSGYWVGVFLGGQLAGGTGFLVCLVSGCSLGTACWCAW